MHDSELQKAIALAAAGNGETLEKWGSSKGYQRQKDERLLAYLARVCVAVESEKDARTKRQSFAWRLSLSSSNEEEYRKVFAETAAFLGLTVTDSRQQRTA